MQTQTSNRVGFIINFILSELKIKLPKHYTYHNLGHTRDVIDQCHLAGSHYGLSMDERNLLGIAAAAHDYGFIISPVEHELIGADMVSILMGAYGFRDRAIRSVRKMILATKREEYPQNIQQAILMDCDLDYLGREDYSIISGRLFDELSYKESLDEESWLNVQISFLENHVYYTSFARSRRDAGKAKNLNDLLLKKAEMINQPVCI